MRASYLSWVALVVTGSIAERFANFTNSTNIPSTSSHVWSSNLIATNTTAFPSSRPSASFANVTNSNSSAALSAIALATLGNSTVTKAPYLNYNSSVISSSGTNTTTRNACQIEFDEWTKTRNDWIPTTQIDYTKLDTMYDVVSSFSTEIYECTSYCGSICYAGPVTTLVEMSVTSWTTIGTYGKHEDYPIAKPTCTIPFNDCLILRSSYTSAWNVWTAIPWEDQIWATYPNPPDCSACVSTTCAFNGMFGLDLYYWPATTSISRDYCASEPTAGPVTNYMPDLNHTYAPITTGPYTVVNGITMYQGNLYLSFQDPYVQDNCGTRVSRKQEGHNVVTIGSSQMFSIRTFPYALEPYAPQSWVLDPYAVNFDDFNEPVPFSAFNGVRTCAQEPFKSLWPCSVVKPGEFNPYMMLPPQIRDLDENWRTCRFDQFANFDPPIALRTVSNMIPSVDAKPTPTANPDESIVWQTEFEKITPAPGQSGGDIGPVVTPGPEVSNHPSIIQTQPKPNEQDGPSNVAGWPASNQPQAAPNNKPMETNGAGSSPNAQPNAQLIANSANSNNPAPPVITVGPSVLQLDNSGNLIVRPGTTLKPGDAPVTLGGTLVRLDSSNIILSSAYGTTAIRIADLRAAGVGQQLITVGPKVFTLQGGKLTLRSDVVLSHFGATAIFAGTTVMLKPDGVVVVVRSSSSTISVASAAMRADSAASAVSGAVSGAGVISAGAIAASDSLDQGNSSVGKNGKAVATTRKNGAVKLLPAWEMVAGGVFGWLLIA